MNLFDNILFDVIILLFPLIICVLYNKYNNIYDKNKSIICEDFAIITSFYFIFKFNVEKPFLLMNLPLVFAYLKDKKTSIFLISFICCIVLSDKVNTLFLIFIMEYILYYLLYINKISGILNFENNIKELEKEKSLRMSLFKITHEIKNPITVCKGYLDMFNTNDKVKSEKYVNVIKNEIDRVLILLEDFLSINKIKIEKDIIDLNLLLEETTNNFIPILKEKNIDRIFNISKDELFINADYNRLKQVLINIIKNSIESIEYNGLLNIYVKQTKTNIKINIEDNGIGMDKEELNKIKEPFFSTKNKGTGLGVYLSNQIIEAHEGKIEYISKKNIGTKTIITLPYKEMVF